MRRQTGNEDDWNNFLSVLTSLGGEIRRSKSEGLQREVAEEQRGLQAQKRQASDYVASGLQRGESPDTLMSSATGMPTQEQGFSYSPNVAIDYSGAEGISPSMVSDALTNEMAQRASRFKAQEDESYQKYLNKFRSVPIDQLMKSTEVTQNDFSAYGNEASAASRAAGTVVGEYSKMPALRNQIESTNREYIAGKAKEFSDVKNLSRNLLKLGERDNANQIMVNAYNDHNTAYKAKITDDGKIQRYITEKGVDKMLGKPMKSEAFNAELQSLSDRDFVANTWAAMQHAREENEKGARNPDIYVNPKTNEVISARPWFNPRGGDNKWVIAANGQEKIIDNLGDVHKMGFVPAETLTKLRALRESQKKNLDVQGMKYKEALRMRSIMTDAINSGLPFALDPNGGYMATRSLTPDERATFKEISRTYGMEPAMSSSVEEHWWPFRDKQKYEYQGMSPYIGEQTGLNADELNTGNSNIGTRALNNINKKSEQRTPERGLSTAMPGLEKSINEKYFGQQKPMDINYKKKIAELIYNGQEKPANLPESDWNAVKDEMGIMMNPKFY